MAEREMKHCNSLEEFVVSSEQELQELGSLGNVVAQEWAEKLQTVSSLQEKLVVFGEMRVALLRDSRPEARALLEEFFA